MLVTSVQRYTEASYQIGLTCGYSPYIEHNCDHAPANNFLECSDKSSFWTAGACDHWQKSPFFAVLVQKIKSSICKSWYWQWSSLQDCLWLLIACVLILSMPTGTSSYLGLSLGTAILEQCPILCGYDFSNPQQSQLFITTQYGKRYVTPKHPSWSWCWNLVTFSCVLLESGIFVKFRAGVISL